MSRFINQIVQGDCRRLIAEIGCQSVNLVITCPPYFRLREYTPGNIAEIGSEQCVDDYIANVFAIFIECARVITDDGSIVFNLGDRSVDGSYQMIPQRFAINVIDQTTMQLANHFTWVKSNPAPKPHRKRMIPSTEPFFSLCQGRRLLLQHEQNSWRHRASRENAWSIWADIL